jgi:signal peptidase II
VDDASRPLTSGLGRHLLAPIGIAASVLAVDQITKWLVAERWGRDAKTHRNDLLGDVLAIHYLENTGVAFGLFQGQVILVTAMAILIVLVLLRTYRHASSISWAMAIGCGLIVGGALGNLVDRVRLGYVVDFVAVAVWPKFNVADSAITVGALLVVWHYLRAEGRDGSSAREGDPAVPARVVRLQHDGDR